MRRIIGAPLAGALLLIGGSATPARAQLCMGAPSFAHYSWQLGLSYETAGGVPRAGISFSGGRDGLFAIGLVKAGHVDESRGATLVTGGTIGSDLAVGRSRHVHACPVFTALYTFGPNPADPAIEVSTVSLAAGGRVGIISGHTHGFLVVPTVGLQFAHDQTRLSVNGQRSAEAGDGFAMAQFGLGFVLDDAVAITPEIVIAFRRVLNTTYRITGTFGFGVR